MWPPRTVVDDSYELQHRTFRRLPGVGEAVVAQEAKDGALVVVGEPVMRMPASATSRRLRPTEVQKMQGAAGFQYASNLIQRAFLLATFEVVQHERGQHAIERGVWVVQRIRKSAIELDARANAPGFPRRSRERFVVGINANDVDIRARCLRKNDQAPCAAADIEHTMTGKEVGLAQKLPSCVVESQQRREGIVEGQQPLDAHSRDEWSVRC